ncbi:MAG TPA: MFS transporter, partial [Gammaproteobacteria bacterium]|nr:MFS transporter [Gammaproteobacteria bacterium]
MQKSNSKWLWPFAMFFVATFFYLYEFLLRVIPSVMLPQLFLEYQIGAEEYGVLASIYYASYAPLQLPVGAWIDRYGTRRLLTFAILLCALSTLLSAYTTNFEIALLARLLIGAGSAFGFISCIKIVAIWFPPSWFPILTGFTLTIGTLGAVASAPISFAMNF